MQQRLLTVYQRQPYDQQYEPQVSEDSEENCWDNSVAESFFGSLKTERVFDSLYPTRETARRDIVDYIEMFFNSRRRHSYLGYLSPNDFEKMMELKKAA